MHPRLKSSQSYRYVRVTSARSLAGMTVFSMLVNLTLGSTMSRSITQPDLNLTRGLISIAVIFGFEYVTDWLSARHSGLAKLFEKEPELLAFRGQIDYKALKSNRLAEGAIWMTMRQKGYLCLSEASRRLTAAPTYLELREQSVRHLTDCYFIHLPLVLSLHQVEAVVLEMSGQISVVKAFDDPETA